jgi:hypothetical protein
MHKSKASNTATSQLNVSIQNTHTHTHTHIYNYGIKIQHMSRMAAMLVQILVQTLLNCITMLCFTLGHTVHRYYMMPYMFSLNIIFYLKASHLSKLIFKTVAVAIYSTLHTAVDSRVYFTSVTIITTVKTGIKILTDSNSLWVTTNMHSSVNSKKTLRHFSPWRWGHNDA